MVDKLDGQAKVAVPNSNQMVISIRVNGWKVDGLADKFESFRPFSFTLISHDGPLWSMTVYFTFFM